MSIFDLIVVFGSVYLMIRLAWRGGKYKERDRILKTLESELRIRELGKRLCSEEEAQRVTYLKYLINYIK